MSTKGYPGFFLFCLDPELFVKIKKDLVSTQSFFRFLLITQVLSKIKNPEHPFVEIVKYEMCAKFQQIISNFVVVAARRSFQFSRQIVWFLRNNRALSIFKYQILYMER